MKIPQLVIFCLVFAGAAFGQCALTLKDAPAVRGLRLGMTPDEVVAVLGKPTARDTAHITYLAIALDEESRDVKIIRPNNFDGIDSLTALVAGEKVTAFQVSYSADLVKWASAAEYSAAVSEKLKLPSASWTYQGSKAYLSCTDWMLTLDAVNNSLLLIDFKAVDRRRAEQKKAFQP